MKKFDGKILLELGTSVGSVEIVKYAQEQGAYVIVTDYLPTEKSAAKKIANETAMVSTTDVEALCLLAKEKQVDGVFCGVSEPNLVSVQAVSERLGLHCYFTHEQWDSCEDKQKFKALCIQHGIPVANEYKISDINTITELNNIKYPVIVKPVDRSAAIGIHICHNNKELLAGYKDAIGKSFSHQVIIEEYITGNEFSASYTIIDGNYKLSMMGDKYLNSEQDGLLPLPEAYVYPSKNLNIYLSKCNEKVVNMFKSIGLKNGTVFVQGIINGEKIAVFEAGLRMGGTALYRFVNRINGINILALLTDYSLLGKMDENINKEDVLLKGKQCCLLSLLNKGGTIGEISGLEKAAHVKGVAETIVRYNVGDTIDRSGTLKQSHIRFFIIRETLDDLSDSIHQIQKHIRVIDTDGNNMLFSPFNTQLLKQQGDLL